MSTDEWQQGQPTAGEMRTSGLLEIATLREFCEPVEQVTGRKVRSFHSSVDTKVDGLAAESFVLYPEGEDGPSRIKLAGADDV
jgi:hypothetical protein